MFSAANTLSEKPHLFTPAGTWASMRTFQEVDRKYFLTVFGNYNLDDMNTEELLQILENIQPLWTKPAGNYTIIGV